MSTYQYCGLSLLSNIAIPELPYLEMHGDGFRFCLGDAQPHLVAPSWSHQWFSSSGLSLLSYLEQNSYHWLQFPGLADFRISADLSEIHCYPLYEIPKETVLHLLLDQVLPRCMAHQGKIMMHASAVKFEHGTILFLGDSGAGKSTLAGNFHQAGQTAVADDCLWINESNGSTTAVPSYGGLRLWEDSLEVLFSLKQVTHPMAHYSSKKRIPLKEDVRLQTGKSLPVLAVIVLSPPGQTIASDILLERLSNREAFIAMMQQSFHLNVLDLERMTHHIQALGQIVPRLPAFRLSMPRNYDLLPTAREKIIQAVLP